MITFRILRRLKYAILRPWWHMVTWMKWKGYGVKCGRFKTTGIPYVVVSRGGIMEFGDGLTIHNHPFGNPLCSGPCRFFVGPGKFLKIGNRVGISDAVLVAQDNLTIGNHVKIGAGVRIFTTDFHSLHPDERMGIDKPETAPVCVGDNAFLGAGSTILKGVSIGRNAVVGAGSVVTHDIPEGEIWAGNPARMIRRKAVV